MVDLMSLAPALVPVTLSNGKQTELAGVDAAGLVYLFRKFPKLREMIARGKPDIPAFLDMGGEGPHALIACGLGLIVGDAKADAAAIAEIRKLRLGLGDQGKLIAAIVKATFPEGSRSFIEMVEGLGDLLTEASPEGQATK